MGLLIFFFLISIFFSFLCSIWEAVILSITPSYANTKVLEGGSIGKLLKAYKEDIDKPLSAILTLNTIAHTVGAIGVGAQAGEVFGEGAMDLGFISISMESIIAGVMTLAILILSEIIPKTIGANMWKQLAPFTIRSIRVLLWILSPFVWLSQLITKSLKREKDKSVLSRADFVAMTKLGLESGAIDSSESNIIENLLKLEKLQAKDIMTPRTVMVTAEAKQGINSFYQTHKPIAFSRIPIYEGKPDHITGMVLKDELLLQLAEDNHEMTLGEIKRDTSFIRDDVTVTALMDALIHTKTHLAIVTDQYGSVVGLVSMEDVFETLLGLEIIDESDKEADLQKLARQRWEERAKRLGLID